MENDAVMLDSTLDQAIALDGLGFRMFNEAKGDRVFKFGGYGIENCKVRARYRVFECDTADPDTGNLCDCGECCNCGCGSLTLLPCRGRAACAGEA